jgi:GDP-mannose 6-dehydrogenase
MENSTNIAVFGLGYVGCVTAACLAARGHRVAGVDTSAMKVACVEAGRAPFYEPGLEAIVASERRSGRLRATVDAEAALAEADIALLCVGTPSERNGNLDLSYIRRVSEQIGAHLEKRGRPLVVAVRSTVFPGTAEEVVWPALGRHRLARVVSNPEFLREGQAVDDFLSPSLLVVGGEDRPSMERVAGLYAGLPVEPCFVALRTAEMIKYACNAFHALKVAFANELGTLAGELGVPALEVMETLCCDRKLNISSAYLRPGFAFGGSCLPKDVRALCYRASRADLKLPLLDSLLESNENQIRRAVRRVLDLGDRRIGVYGLAFKEETDDLRESPVVSLLETLLGKGRRLSVYDPRIRISGIYGANRNFVLSAIPHIERLMAGSLEELLAGAEHLVIAQKPDRAALEAIRASGLPRLDLVYAFGDSGGR